MTDSANGSAEGGDRSDDGITTVIGGDGRRVAYAEYGDPAGRPTVFLHGTPGSRVLGGLFDGAARRAGVRLLAPDRPGYGRSAPWPTRTLGDTGAFVGAVLDDANVSRAHVVGFSGGGPHALALAAECGDRVRAVDLVSGAVPPRFAESKPAALRLFEGVAARAPTVARCLARVQSWVAARASPSLVVSQYTASGDGDPVSDAVAERVRRDFVAAFERHRSGFVTETRLLARPWDVSLDAIETPVRLWHGGRDANVSVEGARRLAAALPEATLTTFGDADHLRTLLRSRERVASAVRDYADGPDDASPRS